MKKYQIGAKIFPSVYALHAFLYRRHTSATYISPIRHGRFTVYCDGSTCRVEVADYSVTPCLLSNVSIVEQI